MGLRALLLGADLGGPASREAGRLLAGVASEVKHLRRCQGPSQARERLVDHSCHHPCTQKHVLSINSVPGTGYSNKTDKLSAVSEPHDSLGTDTNKSGNKSGRSGQLVINKVLWGQ